MKTYPRLFYIYVGIILLAAASFLALRPAPATAQDNAICSQYAEKVLSTIGNSCGDLDRNMACYGFNRVDATFVRPIDDLLFSRPADRVSLVELQTLATAPLPYSLEEPRRTIDQNIGMAAALCELARLGAYETLAWMMRSFDLDLDDDIRALMTGPGDGPGGG